MPETTSKPVDAQRVISHRAELFTSLSLTEGYQELVRELERKIEKMRANAALIALNPEGVDQRQLDYDRGFIDALKYIPSVVAHSERVLEKLDAQPRESEPDDDRSVW